MDSLRRYMLWFILFTFGITGLHFFWVGIPMHFVPDKESLSAVSGNIVDIEYEKMNCRRDPGCYPQSLITIEIMGDWYTYKLPFLKALGDYTAYGSWQQRGSLKLNRLSEGAPIQLWIKYNSIWQIEAGGEMLMTYEDLVEYSLKKSETNVLFGFLFLGFGFCFGYYSWRKGDLY